MDSVVYAALEEVCSQGGNGLALEALWPKLSPSLASYGLHPCAAVKSAVWTNLLSNPALLFEAKGVSYDSSDPKLQSLEEAERLGLKILAAEHLRNSFVGIYDIKASDAGISQPQRRVLERLAIARTNGITQSELAKEFGMKGNNIFYVLRNLESRGLIVKQSTIVRTKEASKEGETKSSSIVNTNMLHLYRYAKHLGCQQRLEITKRDKPLLDNENVDLDAANCDSVSDEFVKDDVHVKDFLPALKAICDKLELADGKILVVSDIKRDLGYRRTSGHRAWRNILNRLKDARVLEEFCAKVSGKEVSCLRLLKSFSPKNFEPKMVGRGDDDLDTEQLVKLGKRGEITDQLMELPIEHQIYDMVDAEGSKGIMITEVCKRLGINNKRYYTRLLNMFSRFGMHIQAESHNKGVAYRVWTSRNLSPATPNSVFGNQEIVLKGDAASNPSAGELAPAIPESDLWTSKAEVRDIGTSLENAVEPELSCGSAERELCTVSTAGVTNVAALETSSLPLSMPHKQRSYPIYPCLNLTAASAQREQWVLQRLQEEKFIVRAELRRELERLGKDKQTTMDRKTLDRTLNKLQQEGYCKCIRVSVPVVSNCGRNRTTEVVLQPSIDVSPELLCQIHERLRSFDFEVRAEGSSRLKKCESVPVLDGVQRIFKSEKLDVQAEKSEAMRANGFVLAKMVRTKLLHLHLWSHLSSSAGWDGALSSGKHGYDLKNPHSTCKLFSLDAAIKAMPLELFLQVVGSTQKFEDMIEKCRSGLCLSNLSEQEYKHLMDTRATGRLSCIIDILRRLKLIRLVRDGHSEDIINVSHATLAYALELRPYVEEPISIIGPSSGVIPFDLRPQIRHDFILTSRNAVDEYWNTLEYSYAAADSRAALHAFPGSAVHEVFLSRSWASVRVMTAEQRAELLKRVFSDDPNKKFSFKDCEKIAKDLNLTLEQVLRVYYDKRQQRLSKFQGSLNVDGEEFQSVNKRHVSSLRKRKQSSEGRSSKHAKVGTIDEHSSGTRIHGLSSIDSQFTEEQSSFVTCSGEQDSYLDTCQDEVPMEPIQEPEPNGESEHHSFFHECALSRMKPTCKRKFSWTEKAERQLVIEYVRHRAALGANFHRTDWSSLPRLPAPPDACKRRMALLNSDLKFRKAVMRLCNVLGERYAKHLDKLGNRSSNSTGCRVRDSFLRKDCHRTPDDVERNEELGFEGNWDNFDDKNVKIALDEVLQYKRMFKLDSSRRDGSVVERQSDLRIGAKGHAPLETELTSLTPNEEIHNHGGGNDGHPKRLSCHHLPPKYIKLLKGGISVGRGAHESLAISNAAELFKLVFLSTSTAPEVLNMLTKTLRRYSEHDLFAAFNYLREKRIMVGGSGGNPFALSQQFLHNISSSPFPINTGKRAAKFASWLQEKEKDLIEEGIDLTADLQCGDIFYLCALIFSGELIISAYLPDEGVGEVEDSRSLKRKSDYRQACSPDVVKKMKLSVAGEGEIISRREKGFPGIRLCVTRATLSTLDAIDLFKDGDIHNGTPTFSKNDKVNTSSSINVDSAAFSYSHIKQAHNEGSSILTTVTNKSEWETMASYAENLISLPSHEQQASPFCPELFRDVYLAIQKAGDQGLSMEEVSQVMNPQGEHMPELIVDVLEAFGRALKVNAYNSVHVVDSLYRSKYFLTSITPHNHDLEVKSCTNFKSNDRHLNHGSDTHEDVGATTPNDLSMNAEEVHKITILNRPEEVPEPSCEFQGNKRVEREQANLISLGCDHKSETFEFHSSDLDMCTPVLPWVNGDGTINNIVYKGLVRRILGILMQNPGMLEEWASMLFRVDRMTSSTG
ncbi:uncharacterized protein LOC127794928 isoform X2 [Diospyros lotus]|uniref:uncharacterized protein LOC127794928 isoform X2 n=1 Tax=Diospyros lotus TaxID=55363 RepID=UPI002257B5E9|nr:uncharacterized protein LOC127794928 isoform X2 [Diospyros lotus]